MNTASLIDYIFDIVFTVAFFLKLRDERRTPLENTTAVLLLLPLLLVSSGLVPVNTLLRFALRTSIYFLYLCVGKRIPALCALYYALLGTACFSVALNILLRSNVSQFMRHFASGPMLGYAVKLGAAIERDMIFVLFSLFIPFTARRRLEWMNWGSIVAVVLCELYIKEMTYLSLPTSMGFFSEINIYSTLLQVFLIAFVAAIDRFTISRQRQEAADMQHVIDTERLHSLQRQIHAEEAERNLRHDMKNHLLSIAALTEARQDGQEDPSASRIRSYVDTLLDEISDCGSTINTGNELLDGFISQKIADSKARDISFQVVANFSNLSFIADIDLCTIFGNALDNAIEAASAVPDRGNRLITLKSEIAAGKIILYFGNTYAGPLASFKDLPSTTKQDRSAHGIGLHNLRQTVGKYNGTIHIDTTEPNLFRLIIMLPAS